jgi:hypothetical protein
MQPQRVFGKEYVLEDGNVRDDEWQRWQASYAVRRRDTFLRILEARWKGQGTSPMKRITTISKDRNCYIELSHYDADPGMWIVRRWKKFMWFKRRLSSNWFSDEQQARAFADEMKRKHVAVSPL